MKKPALGAALLLLVASVFVALIAHSHAVATGPRADLVARLPLKTPAAAIPATRLTLPEQRGLKPGQVYLGWRLLDAGFAPNTLILRWDNTLDPPLPGCGSRPVAVQVGETADSIRIGLIGPIPPSQPHCSAVGAVAYIDVQLVRPAGHRAVYQISG